MGANERRPGCRALPLRGRRYIVAPQNVAYCLVRDLVPEVGQRPYDSIIAPVRIFLSHTDNQLLDFVAYLGPAKVSPHLRTIELLSNELPEPAEDRIRFGGVGHV